jgi:hypothetical protein
MTLVSDFLLAAAGSVPVWRDDAIGLLLVVIAGCLLAIGWVVAGDEASL